MKPVLISFFFLGWAFNAMAQERVVSLQKGGTVWAVLQEEGCSQKQITNLWPLVVKDSGLNPEEARSFQINTSIVLKRGCDGRTFEAAVLRLENEKLKTTLVSLGSRLQKSALQAGNLEARIKELEKDLENLQFYSGPRFFAASGLALLAGFLFGSLLPWIRKNFFPNPETPLEFPKQMIVEHWGKEHVFSLYEEPSTCRVGYSCPILHCNALIPRPKNCKRHFRENHKDEGRFEWVFPEKVPASP